MRKDIRICGKGGQGIMLSGYILGKASSVFHHFNAVQMQSYGPEARGGAARSEVIISDEEIGYCGLYEAEYMMVMSQEALDKYSDDLAEDVKIILDPDLVTDPEVDSEVGEKISVPATNIAEELGNKIVANIVMLGALNHVAEIVPEDILKEAVEDNVPSKFLDLNMKAVQKGIEYVQSR